MFYPKRQLILTCVAAMLAGSLLHFLHGWLPNPVTALFSPTSESLWEHSKIILWPFLGAALLLTRGRPGGLRPWLLALPPMVAVMLGLGWLYHITCGGEEMWVDLVIYILVMAGGFWLATRFSGPFQGGLWLLPVIAGAVLVCLVVWFTFYPPKLLLFRDLSAAGSWLSLPC